METLHFNCEFINEDFFFSSPPSFSGKHRAPFSISATSVNLSVQNWNVTPPVISAKSRFTSLQPHSQTQLAAGTSAHLSLPSRCCPSILLPPGCAAVPQTRARCSPPSWERKTIQQLGPTDVNPLLRNLKFSVLELKIKDYFESVP